MSTFDMSITERQRQLIIQALHQFRIENCPEEVANALMALPVEPCAEENLNAESMLIAGMMEDMDSANAIEYACHAMYV